MGLITKDNRDYYIKRMARHYNKTTAEIEKRVDENPETLENFAEYLANDCFDYWSSHRNYGAKYYE
jgi:hypothetical protein